ncbi:xanthine dehydrogenase accessory protein XdhC [Donghicola sp.]|jgi:xanthine dehydrogenase accessory factor|uniref:xanthine dehydrogenase accessory protein XdhC n=1 Tax=Donghicola sp. TaxID=1929294 RepID=UPI0025CE8310|nr:xanthine dehydrogenase accessory protein XdhC [Donghicola sp.]MCT4575774.1 xanthine dehydrogenase accessory protein XdhC [Donghicola sp.]
MLDRAALEAAVAAHGTVARVVILEARGSVPRGAGTEMLVWPEGQSGTIGGGRLEFDAAAAARQSLTDGRDIARLYPLGPALGQCCGGSVRVLTEIFDATRLATVPSDGLWARPLPGVSDGTPPSREGLHSGWFAETLAPARAPLWIWGAGHVGRAIVHTMSPLPDFAITWIDTAADRFPETCPAGTETAIAAQPDRLAMHAPTEAMHLILTYSHEIDFALCHALLTRGFGFCGLIGSDTKWARFQKRLMTLGHPQDQISRITCPIGNPALGKHPQAIAVGVAAALLNSPNDEITSGDGTQWARHS